MHNLLRDRILFLQLRLVCSLTSRTGVLLEANFGRSLLCAEVSLSGLRLALIIFSAEFGFC